MKPKKKFDTPYTGLLLGIILPVVTLAGFWLVRFDGGFFEFLGQFQNVGMLSKVLSLCTLPNLLPFFLFIWTNRIFSARGVIFATLIIAFVMLLLKFA